MPQRGAPRNREREWDGAYIAVEALTVAVFAPLSVVLIVTHSAAHTSTWWWLVAAGMSATWAGESVGNMATHVWTVRGARRRHQRRGAHPGDRHTGRNDAPDAPGGRDDAGGHRPAAVRSEGDSKPGDPR